MRAIRARQIRRIATAVVPHLEDPSPITGQSFTTKSYARRIRRRFSRRI